jgi:hypothetical protein
MVCDSQAPSRSNARIPFFECHLDLGKRQAAACSPSAMSERARSSALPQPSAGAQDLAMLHGFLAKPGP